VVVARGDVVVARDDVVVARGDVVAAGDDVVAARGDVVVARGEVVVARDDVVAVRDVTRLTSIDGASRLLPLLADVDTRLTPTSPACRSLLVVVEALLCLVAAPIHLPLLPVTGGRADETGSWLDDFLLAASTDDVDVLFLELNNFNLSIIDASRQSARLSHAEATRARLTVLVVDVVERLVALQVRDESR